MSVGIVRWMANCGSTWDQMFYREQICYINGYYTDSSCTASKSPRPSTCYLGPCFGANRGPKRLLGCARWSSGPRYIYLYNARKLDLAGADHQAEVQNEREVITEILILRCIPETKRCQSNNPQVVSNISNRIYLFQ